MSFFTDPKCFTHYGSLCGVPIYIADLESEGPSIAGTNAIYDWLVLWWPGFVVFWIDLLAHCAIVMGCLDEDAYQPMWAICVKGEL